MSESQKQSIWLALAAMSCLTLVMMIYALKGMDGVLFGAFATALGALGGITIYRRLRKGK